MRGGDVFDKVLGAYEPAYTPARSVEVLSCRAHRKGQSCNFWGKSGDACERDIVEAVINFIGEDDDIIFYA